MSIKSIHYLEDSLFREKIMITGKYKKIFTSRNMYMYCKIYYGKNMWSHLLGGFQTLIMECLESVVSSIFVSYAQCSMRLRLLEIISVHKKVANKLNICIMTKLFIQNVTLDTIIHFLTRYPGIKYKLRQTKLQVKLSGHKKRLVLGTADLWRAPFMQNSFV